MDQAKYQRLNADKKLKDVDEFTENDLNSVLVLKDYSKYSKLSQLRTVSRVFDYFKHWTTLIYLVEKNFFGSIVWNIFETLSIILRIKRPSFCLEFFHELFIVTDINCSILFGFLVEIRMFSEWAVFSVPLF